MFDSQQKSMATGALSPARAVMFYLLFFAICCGLGYPILQRYDPATVGVEDVAVYSTMVVDGPAAANDSHMLFRVVIPGIARPIYRLAIGHIGTWNPVRFSLLVVDSAFVSGTALLLLWVAATLCEFPVAFAASLLYLLNFAVSNSQLVGLVDAGEAFCLMALVAALMKQTWWPLPVIAAAGASTKESFLPFATVLLVTWLATDARHQKREWLWVLGTIVAGTLSMCIVQLAVSGAVQSPTAFAANLRGSQPFTVALLHPWTDRTVWYVFVWLIPVALPRLKRLPRPWLFSTLSMSTMAMLLNAYHEGARGTLARVWFTIAGAPLSIAAAMWLVQDRNESSEV